MKPKTVLSLMPGVKKRRDRGLLALLDRKSRATDIHRAPSFRRLMALFLLLWLAMAGCAAAVMWMEVWVGTRAWR